MFGQVGGRALAKAACEAKASRFGIFIDADCSSDVLSRGAGRVENRDFVSVGAAALFADDEFAERGVGRLGAHSACGNGVV